MLYTVCDRNILYIQLSDMSGISNVSIFTSGICPVGQEDDGADGCSECSDNAATEGGIVPCAACTDSQITYNNKSYCGGMFRGTNLCYSEIIAMQKIEK